MRKKAASRILAYVLTLCMIIGSITWPEITAKAESITQAAYSPAIKYSFLTIYHPEFIGFCRLFSPAFHLQPTCTCPLAGYPSASIFFMIPSSRAS